MKSVLLYYSFGFALGGGEYLPLSFIAELQNMCDLTVAVDLARNFERSYESFGKGLDIDRSKIKIVQVTPPDYDPKRHSAKTSLYRFRQLKRLARNADVCISTSSIMDFGKPAHHFINMLAFGDDAFTEYIRSNYHRAKAGAWTTMKRFVSDSVLRPILGLRSKQSIIHDSRQHIYPNSRYVEKVMTQYYGPFNSTVFYPPTLFEANYAESVERDTLRVVYIGRIIPEKRITNLIGIVEKARSATSLPITFHLAGRLDQTPKYGEMLAAMAQERDWLKFVGVQYGDEKSRFLMSGSFAIHAERDEAFGIAVAEYLVAGLIPIVPDEGGTPEVVNSPALAYSTDDDAACILARLATDDSFREEQRRLCAERAQFFSKDAYLARQGEMLRKIMAG